MNPGMTGKFFFKNPKLQQKGLPAELFEEKIQEIDQDIGIFDSTPELFFKNSQCTGKENSLESLTINDAETGRLQPHAHSLPCST